MGVAKLGEIRDQLLAGGMAADTPVAMIENASLPEQRECRSDLASMSDDACAFGLKSPAILVIGAVAAVVEDQKIAACGSSYFGSALVL
ncbi:Siroheme synthase [compost metagenome]